MCIFITENKTNDDRIMKRISISFLLTLFMSMMGVNAFAYDIRVQNADGATIYYNYINDNTELEVTRIMTLILPMSQPMWVMSLFQRK